MVDDNAINRRILQEMLLNWRMRPTVVESAARALEEMSRATEAQADYQLILLDAMMPGMDGFTLAAKIQAQPSARRCHRDDAFLGHAGRGGRSVAPSRGSPAFSPNRSRNRICSTPYRRARFRHCESRSRARNSRHQIAPPNSGLRILVAEDNLINRALATGILEKLGHTLVTRATEGKWWRPPSTRDLRPHLHGRADAGYGRL